VAETNGIGRPAIDRGWELGLHIDEFTMTSASKQEIMFYLASQIERGGIRFLDDPDLRKEFAHFRVNASPSGGYTFRGEGTIHDDVVCSVALAVHESRYSFGI
jgi:phage FluMu gp28-like protein